MTTKTADQKSVRATGKAGINLFPKAKLVAQLALLAKSKVASDHASEETGTASLTCLSIAADYGVAAMAVCGDTSTVLEDWRDNMRVLAMELAVAGSPFAEIKEGKDGKPNTARMTGTGRNVLSIAKGVIDFGIVVADCVEEHEPASYRSVRKVVEAKRQARRDVENPEAAALEAAKDAAREAFGELSETVFKTGDVGLIRSLAAALLTMNETAQADLAKVAELEAATKPDATPEPAPTPKPEPKLTRKQQRKAAAQAKAEAKALENEAVAA